MSANTATFFLYCLHVAIYQTVLLSVTLKVFEDKLILGEALPLVWIHCQGGICGEGLLQVHSDHGVGSWSDKAACPKEVWICLIGIHSHLNRVIYIGSIEY